MATRISSRARAELVEAVGERYRSGSRLEKRRILEEPRRRGHIWEEERAKPSVIPGNCWW
jgi:hypothetical protein